MISDKLKESQFTCIMCPLGCAVTVKADVSGVITEVLGNKCKKGDVYARGEFTRPMRVLTSTVAIEGAKLARLPIRTSALIPKDKIFDCMKEIFKLKAKAPIKNGDLISKDMLGLGVDVIATRDLD